MPLHLWDAFSLYWQWNSLPLYMPFALPLNKEMWRYVYLNIAFTIIFEFRPIVNLDHVTPKRVTSWSGPSMHHCACWQHSSLLQQWQAIGIWQHYFRFDLKFWELNLRFETSNFPPSYEHVTTRPTGCCNGELVMQLDILANNCVQKSVLIACCWKQT